MTTNFDTLELDVLGSNNFSERIYSNQIQSLSDVVRTAQDIQDNCIDLDENYSDYVYHSRDLGRLTIIGKYYDPTFTMTKHSLSQLCAKIGMNKTYYNTCYDKGALELLDYNMTYWLVNYNKPLLFRTYKNYLRGVLSSKFTTFDAPEILGVINDIPNFTSNFDLKGSFISPERLHLRFIQDRRLFSDDDLFGGFTIDSSDVGRNALEIKFFIYKQVCTNGLCLPQFNGFSYRRKHIGLNNMNFKEHFVEAMNEVTNICDNVKDLILKAKNTRLSLYDDTKKDRLKELTTLSENDFNDKLMPLISDVYGVSAWGVTNAITQVAQDFTLERRLELEKRAGIILNKLVA